MFKNYIFYSYILLVMLTLPIMVNAQQPNQSLYEYCGPQYGYPCLAQNQLQPQGAYRPGVNPAPPRFVNTIDFSIGNDSAMLDYRYESPLYDVNAAYLSNDDNDSDAYYFGVLAGGYYQQILPAPTRMSIGVIGVGVDTEEGDGGAAALAGAVRFPLNVAFPGLAVEAKVSYAPSIISFGDIENFFEIDAKLVYNALPNASVFAGLRNIQAEVEKSDGTTEKIKIGDGFYGGVRLRF